MDKKIQRILLILNPPHMVVSLYFTFKGVIIYIIFHMFYHPNVKSNYDNQISKSNNMNVVNFCNLITKCNKPKI